MAASEKEIDKQAEANEDWQYCVVCNITKTHIDELRKLVGQKLRTAGRYIFRNAIFAGMPACDVLSIRQDVMDRPQTARADDAVCGRAAKRQGVFARSGAALRKCVRCRSL